jgi:hypothetical protein
VLYLQSLKCLVIRHHTCLEMNSWLTHFLHASHKRARFLYATIRFLYTTIHFLRYATLLARYVTLFARYDVRILHATLRFLYATLLARYHTLLTRYVTLLATLWYASSTLRYVSHTLHFLHAFFRCSNTHWGLYLAAMRKKNVYLSTILFQFKNEPNNSLIFTYHITTYTVGVY